VRCSVLGEDLGLQLLPGTVFSLDFHGEGEGAGIFTPLYLAAEEEAMMADFWNLIMAGKMCRARGPFGGIEIGVWMEGQSSGDLACPTMSLMSKLDLSPRRSPGTSVFGEIFNSRELMKGREGVWQLGCQRGMRKGISVEFKKWVE